MDTSNKKLMMLSANYSEIPLILAAKDQGFYVVTTGNNPNQPAHKFADEYAPHDYSDYDGMVELARDLGITAISQGCSDNCALTAAYMGEKLGLKGHDTFENAKIIHRKTDFKKFTEKEHIKSPLARYFYSYEEAIAFDTEGLYPLIVKPTDQAGGKGVSRVDNRKEYENALKYAFDRTRAGEVVVEAFIEGTLHSLSTFLLDQKVAAWSTFNDYSYVNRFMTNSGICPADNWELAAPILIEETEKVAQKLHLVDGLLHMQYIMRGNEPWIIEMMRRTPGNNCTTASSRATGINWRDWIIRAEAGMDCHGIPSTRMTEKYYGYHAIMSNCNGVFDCLDIAPDFKNKILDTVMYEPSGAEITDYLYEKMGVVQFYLESEAQKDHYMKQINEVLFCKMK
ncbi:MAG: ATP-grasp domain-containing protein [Oscillospiraceae bacterium]|nr:ATP-grasp domain-containing protein [Oscillospiraceae bacterium]